MYGLFDGAPQEELKISLQASLRKFLDESVLKVFKHLPFYFLSLFIG